MVSLLLEKQTVLVRKSIKHILVVNINESYLLAECGLCMFNPLDAGLEVEVKDPPKGMIPPGTQMVKPKAEPQPSKVRPTHLTPHTHLRTHTHL